MGTDFFLNALITGGLLLLAFIKLTNVISANSKANIYFGVFLILWSSFWLDHILMPELNAGKLSPAYNLLYFIQFLTPIAFFLSVLFYTRPDYHYTASDTKYAAIPVMFAGLLLFRPFIAQSAFSVIFISFILIHALLYSFFALRLINRHQRNIETFASSTEPINLHWLRYIIYGVLASCIIVLIYNILLPHESLNLFMNVYFVVVVYFVAYHSVKQKEIYPKGFTLKPEEEELRDAVTEKPKLMEDVILDDVKQRLIQLMDIRKPYLDSELTLIKLSEMMEVSSHQLSYVINNGIGGNFFNFINTYRVELAKELLLDPAYSKMTILYIGFEAGFNSKTSFNTSFKKITSYTPSDYRKKYSDL